MKLPITKRAFVKAGMLRLGEPVAWGSDADLIEEQSELIEELAAALEPFAAFADAWDKQPLRGIDDRLYSLHGETHFCLSDAKRARAVLAKAKGE